MKRPIIRIAMLLCWLMPAAALAMPVYSGLVVFGDSFSDSGNNAAFFDAALGGGRTAVPLAPPDLIPEAPYPSDRYSNGPVWVEQFAARLGLSARASRLGGTNYAHGGARTGPTDTGFPPSLRDQVNGFLATAGGSAPAENLYVIAGGGNDARDALMAAAAGDTTLASSLIDGFWRNISSMVTDLHAAGATDFLVWNVPDIGLAPAIRAVGDDAAGLGTAVAMQMNALLDQALTGLESRFAVDLFRFDAFGLIEAIVDDPMRFGLHDARSACALSIACIEAPGGHFFWDGIHPTAAGHGIVAQAALRSVAEPPGFALMALGLLVCWGERRRRCRNPLPVAG